MQGEGVPGASSSEMLRTTVMFLWKLTVYSVDPLEWDDLCPSRDRMD